MRYTVLLVCLFISRLAAGQLVYETVWVDYDSVWTYKSLQIIPVRMKGPGSMSAPPMLSLSTALRLRVATISERGSASTENVHWLRLNNNSGKPIFIGSGQTFSGGRQDRIVTKDTVLLPLERDQYIPVMCIEEGRWSEREKKFSYGEYANLHLRKVLDRSRNQVLVWKEILSQLDSALIHSPTFAYNALKQHKPVQLYEPECLTYFMDKFKNADSSICGFVAVSGNKVIGSDVFAGTALFYNELEPLLKGYIMEGLMHGSAPVLLKADIKLYMDNVYASEQVQEDYCRKKGKIFRTNNTVIHVTSY